jgi:hypothetical protein
MERPARTNGGVFWDPGVRIGINVMLSEYRHWLEYDPVALAVLLVGVGFVELMVLSIWPRASSSTPIRWATWRRGVDATFRDGTRRWSPSFEHHTHHKGAASENAHHSHRFRARCRPDRQRLRRELRAAGGNVTGFIFATEPTMTSEWVELLKEIALASPDAVQPGNGDICWILAEPPLPLLQCRRSSRLTRQIRAAIRHCRTGTRANALVHKEGSVAAGTISSWFFWGAAARARRESTSPAIK